jgi:hypothetical protein
MARSFGHVVQVEAALFFRRMVSIPEIIGREFGEPS